MKLKIYIFFLLLVLNCKTSVDVEKKELELFQVFSYKPSSSKDIVFIQFDSLTFPKRVFDYYWNPFWLKNGVEIYFIEQKNKKILEPKEVLEIYNKTIELYNIKNKKIILVGTSLGGISILDLLNSTEQISVDKILVVGVGFDYSYSGNLFKEHPELLNQKIQNINLNFFKRYKQFLLEKYDLEIVEQFYFPDLPLFRKEFLNLGKRKIPILLVVGKIDSFAPEDSIIFFVKNYSKNENFSCKIKTKLDSCYYIEASRANFFDIDYNHFDLFLYDNVSSDLYTEILRWIRL